jgi:hypothetical protein
MVEVAGSNPVEPTIFSHQIHFALLRHPQNPLSHVLDVHSFAYLSASSHSSCLFVKTSYGCLTFQDWIRNERADEESSFLILENIYGLPSTVLHDGSACSAASKNDFASTAGTNLSRSERYAAMIFVYSATVLASRFARSMIS